MQLGKILIIDGSNLLHRQLSQASLQDLKYAGKHTGGVFGFFRSLLVALSRYPSHYPIIVFDKGRSARRLALYPNYKHTDDIKQERAGLKPAKYTAKPTTGIDYREELYRQGDIIISILELLKIPVIAVPGWEGDDIMAILSRLVSDGVVVTDDKDMYQLVSPNVQIFRPIRTNDDGTLGETITFDKVKHPVYNNARSYVIHKSIVGDVSDNIPKVAAGVGDKKAEIITDYIIAANEDPTVYLEVLGNMREPHFAKFIAGHDQYLINKKLIDLSLIEQDPVILNELTQQLISTNGVPSMIDIIGALHREGIQAFDYPKMISHLTRTRHEVN